MSNPRNISQDLRSAVIGVNHTKAVLFSDAKAALWIGGFFLDEILNLSLPRFFGQFLTTKLPSIRQLQRKCKKMIWKMEVAKQGDKRPLIGAAVIFGTSWIGICEIVGVIIRPSGLGIHPMSTISRKALAHVTKQRFSLSSL